MTTKDLATYFFNVTNQKWTGRNFSRTIGQINTLLKEGYTLEEIKAAIDYYVENPPEKGFYSIGWLNYNINQALRQVAIKKIEKQQQGVHDITVTEDKSNREKYKKNSNHSVRGTIKF